ncbi:MAG: hypothetical protein ACPG31_04795 [Planctomycetota bacterium]
MNQLLQTFLIFVTGLIGGLIGSVLLADGGSEATSMDSDSGYTAAADEDLNKTLQALQAKVDTMGRTLELQSSTLLNMQEQMSSAVEMDRALRQGTLPGGEPLPPGMGMAAADMPTGPGFDAALDAALQQRDEAEAAERAERREERRVEQLEQRVADLALELGLSEAQTEEFGRILDDSSKARNDFFTEMRESGSWGDRDSMRAKMTEFRETELESLGGLLNSEQLTQYTELTEFTGFGGRGGGNRGGGNNGGSNSGGGGNRGGNF